MNQAFNMEAREELNATIARMFNTGGLTFNLSKKPYYIKSFTYAASNPIVGYKPPGFNSLRTTLTTCESSRREVIRAYQGHLEREAVPICSDG